MKVRLLTELHLEFLSSKRGCTGSPEFTLVKTPHCWKSHVAAQMYMYMHKSFVNQDVCTSTFCCGVPSNELTTKCFDDEIKYHHFLDN